MKFCIVIVALSSVAAAQTVARFSTDPGDNLNSAYSMGPFPTNILTAADGSQPTGLRINLPASNDTCTAQSAAVCSYSTLLNKLDGFSVNPRLMVCFSGAVDSSSLVAGLSIVSLNGPKQPPIGVDRVFVDPATNCAYAKPAHVLLQQRSYLLAVTDAVKSSGQSVVSDPAFNACASGTGGIYCTQLKSALKTAALGKHVVSASVFTTMSVTPWMQGANSLVTALPGISLPAGLPWRFSLSSVKTLTYHADQSGLGPQDIPLSVLQGVDAVAFGLVPSPSYLNTSGAAAGTITTNPGLPLGVNLLSYHVFLPATHVAKTPVVIYLHGTGDTQFGAPTAIASTFANRGFATLAFELTGHGFGPASTVTVTLRNGATVTEATPGRGIQLSPGAPIGSSSGCIIPGPIGVRDCVRQSAVDLISVLNAIQTTNGLGLGLDPQRVYVIGQSLGSLIGSTALPVARGLNVAVLNGDGGSSVDIARLSPATAPDGSRPLPMALLSLINPALLLNVIACNAPPQPPYNDAFNDNYVLSGQPPIVNTVPCASNVQAAFEAAEWMDMLADPLSYGPYISSHPLPGMPAKHALFQFGISDLEVPNPSETAAVLAADAQNATSILNFPKAVALQTDLATVMDPAFPGLPILPHRILSNPTIFTPGNEAELSLALGDQQQAADFFASNGKKVSDANDYLTDPFGTDLDLFVAGPLPTGLNFLPHP